MYRLIFIPEDDPAEEVVLAEFDTSFAAEAARGALVAAANDLGWVEYNGWIIHALTELEIFQESRPRSFSVDLIVPLADGHEY